MTGNEAKPLSAIYAAAALRELDEIWDWNEKTYGRERAVRYFDFLDEQVTALGADPLKGALCLASPIYAICRSSAEAVVMDI